MPAVPADAGADGGAPVSLIQGADGNLYGTTSMGGAGDLPYGGGTVFKITPAGSLTTLYSFTMENGYSPRGSLIQASDGNFYGVTTEGGSGLNGTTFKITPSGALTILHNFSFEEGGPCGGLVEAADGNLYGCTSGSSDSGGEVFKITTAGVFSNFYSFSAASGVSEATGLILGSDGNFYGTTYEGGLGGGGVIFQLTLSGVLKTIYGFSTAEGMHPTALLQASDGNFYGLLPFGGIAKGGVDNLGTIFRVTPSGMMTTIQNFIYADGELITGGELIRGSDGNIHGATIEGGLYNDGVLFTLLLNTEAQPPSVVTSSASMITIGSVVFSASVNPNGGETQAGFLYSTDSTMTNSQSIRRDIGSSPGAVPLSLQTNDLKAGTTYYYQAFASNSAGTSRGTISDFATPSAATYNISGTGTGVGFSGAILIVTGPDAFDATGVSGSFSFNLPGGRLYDHAVRCWIHVCAPEREFQ